MRDSSEPSRSGDSLEGALDSFLDWARHEDVADRVSELPEPPELQRIGEGTLLGEFTLVRRIGAGGMGMVYEARQASIAGRAVAVKILRNLFSSKRLELRFRREIEAISALDHPGIVPVVAAGIDGGVPYYAMRLVHGTSAARLIRELREHPATPPAIETVRRFVERESEGGSSSHRAASRTETDSAWEPLYSRWVARLGMLVAEALQHAHDRGIVHRDVKPGNVMITTSGRPVLLDFGLADREVDRTITQAGDFLGTLAYASPEQARGEPVDPRSDVYSLGATLYELVTLRRPIDAHPSQIARCIEEEPPDPFDSWVPRGLRTIIGCALSKSPGRRYASAGALADDLRSHLLGLSLKARPPGALERGGRWLRRHARPMLVATLVLTFTILSGTWVQDNVRAKRRIAKGDGHLAAARMHWQRLRDKRDASPRFDEWRLAGVYPPEAPEEVRERVSVEALLERELRLAEESYVGSFAHFANTGATSGALARLHAERLRMALLGYRDITAPASVRMLEGELRQHDRQHVFADWLDRTGRARIVTQPGGALISISRIGPDLERPVHVLDGTTPLAIDRLEEGSYLAEISLGGFAPTRLPFVVRRRAVATLTAIPPEEHAVELVPETDLDERYVHVPGGWTLCSLDPPRWELVPGFLMRRFESTFGEWIALANHSPGRALAPPRDPYDPTMTHAWMDPAGFWRLEDHVDPSWPVVGLARSDMGTMCSDTFLHEPPPEGWYVAMPTPAEWIRAARGADARLYPWGDEFDWNRTLGHRSRPGAPSDLPAPIGARPGDVSPFGIRDLSGSVAEATLAPFPSVRGDFLFCGGSFRVTRPEEMRIGAFRKELNQPQLDAGIRMVLRRIPDWMLAAPGPLEIFHDDFERADAPTPGNGWRVSVSEPLAVRVDPDMTPTMAIAGGRLVGSGGTGHHSEPVMAWHPVTVTEAGFTARAVITGGAREVSALRNFGLRLRSGFTPPNDELSLVVRFDGVPSLVIPGAPDARGERIRYADRPLVFELVVREQHVEGRIWSESEPRPDAPLLVRDDFQIDSPLRFVGFVAQNLVGASLAIDEVSVVPAELQGAGGATGSSLTRK